MSITPEVPKIYSGEELLSIINIGDKYARYNPEKKRRENFDEIVTRVEQFHIKHHPKFASEIVKAFELVKQFKILPSMRSLQFSGECLEINPARINNCAYMPMNHYKCFSELMFLLLSGCGVGYSVENKNIRQLPVIKRARKEKRFLIPDSIEGWADAIKQLMSGAFGIADTFPIFDYRDIRKAGTPLKRTGGKAPGYEALKKSIDAIIKIIDAKQDNTALTSLEIHDICCHIAECVVSGGIRRSACISFFDADDKYMLTCKSGNWWENNLQRQRSNNSVIFNRSKVTEEEFRNMWKKLHDSMCGEPGIMFVNDEDMRGNPCNEIGLYPFTFCNLTEMNVGNLESEEDFFERCKAASFISTLQATYTDFHYLRSIWKESTEKYGQMAVGMTGICDGEIFKYDIARGAQIVKETNAIWAEKLGINPSIACTTIKPSGNTSVVLKTSSGIHARHAKYYWRRMRLNKINPMYDYLKAIVPDLLEDSIRDAGDSIFKVICKSPDHSITRNETALDFLARIKKFSLEWIIPGNNTSPNGNNISATCNIKDDEWGPVADWVWENREIYNGISFLPFDGGNYPQLPFEECTKEEYEECEKYLRDIQSVTPINFDDIIELTDETNLQGEAGCAGGKCDIV